jgi:Zinc carboxypeptidase/Penicillin-insensitive murein endopeptidase
VLRRFALAGALLALAAASASASVDWHRSRSLGLPYAGRLVNGVQLPERGRAFETWDPALKRSPNRGWRRWGSDRLVGLVLRVVREYRLAHPSAPRLLIGDLSRPHGGDFGRRFGGLGHASHQNGLDVDVYYPRRDRVVRPPRFVRQIDRELAQDLLDLFLHAGATRIFVGPHTSLRGPRKVVFPLAHHDNHMHVRIARENRRVVYGHSAGGRPLRALELGFRGRRRVLVVACIHGTECAGTAVVRALARSMPPIFDLWVVPNLNPDGLAARTRQNARGVDLNRNFPSDWTRRGRRWSLQFSGRQPLSERESRFAARLILRVRPQVTIWFHQHENRVRAWGQSIPAARRYARLARMRFDLVRWPGGSAPNWQNHRFPGTSSFVVELPAGRLSATEIARQARAILQLKE